jgi:hypothetical protein
MAHLNVLWKNHVVMENVATMMGPPHFLQWYITIAAIFAMRLG